MSKKIETVIQELKTHLKDYLRLQLGSDVDKKYFNCFKHNEDTPSMSFDPHRDNTIVHCFGCGESLDIFNCASHFEQLPENGTEWIKITIPTLCEKFGIEFETIDLDPQTKEILKLKKFWNDLSNIIKSQPHSDDLVDFISDRYISTEFIPMINEPYDFIDKKLQKLGWDKRFIKEQLTIGNEEDKKFPIIGEDLLSFLIEDKYGHAIGLISKNTKKDGPRYVNSHESLIYKKRESLLGLYTAVKNKNSDTLYIVEGPCDLMALHNYGITNAVALCGTAFSKQQINMIKLSGYRNLCFALDNDEAGFKATKKHLYEFAESLVGLSIFILDKLPDGIKDANDLISDLLEKNIVDDNFLDKKTHAIEWLISLHKDEDHSDDAIVKDLIQFITVEPTASRREFLASKIADTVNISLSSILEDIDFIRKNKGRERQDKIKAAVEKYADTVSEHPENSVVALAQHETELQEIEQEYQKAEVGSSYQTARYDALEEEFENEEENNSTFRMTKMKAFEEAFREGSTWTEGAVFYIGGRPNSGKTLVGWSLASDVLESDEKTIVVAHMTDDSYKRMLPRCKTLIADLLREADEPKLSIGMAASPKYRLNTAAEQMVYKRATDRLRQHLSDGKLFLLDNEDGPLLSVLDRQLKYIRSYDTNSKILILADGAHNYRDWGHLDQNTKMKNIAEAQMDIVLRHKACMLCTAEYRKNMTINPNEIKWPVDDDIADSRALTYRCQVVSHVYNDVNDRRDKASIFYKNGKRDKKEPRIIYYIGKNKLSSFKDKMAFDIDPFTVTLSPVHIDQAREDEELYLAKQNRKNDDE